MYVMMGRRLRTVLRVLLKTQSREIEIKSD